MVKEAAGLSINLSLKSLFHPMSSFVAHTGIWDGDMVKGNGICGVTGDIFGGKDLSRHGFPNWGMF